MEPNQAAFDREALDPNSEGRPSVGLVAGVLAAERYIFDKYATELAAARGARSRRGSGRASRRSN